MTLTVTPGSASADSYATLAEANTYHTDHGNAAWVGSDAVKEVALRRAVVWVDFEYRSQWPGIRTDGRDQALSWPRSSAFDAEGVPIPVTEVPSEVKDAQMESALREVVETGSLSPDYVGSARVISEAVGPLKTTFADVGGPSALAPVLSIVDGILASLLGVTSRGVVDLVRA